MAILWSRTSGGTHYEVRSSGATRRLYTNGVLHTQYNPRTRLTGSVWDLLMLPAFFRPPDSVRRVLVLGVGGGAVIRQLAQFVRPGRIVGVELDPLHLYIAERFFGLAEAGVSLQQAEARGWLEAYDGPRFDMIVDDLFGEREGEPERAVAASGRWFETLLRNLSPSGVIAMNFVGRRELRESGFFRSRRVAGRFAAAFELTTPVDENAVGAFLRAPSDSRTLRRRLTAVPGMNPMLKTSPLRYRIRRI